MREIPIVVHLTVHKIAFHLKFPATLSLELELDRKTTCMVDGIVLGKETIIVNRQSRFEATLNYDESSKTYENKKALILLTIKTKTSENKLTAGVIPLQLTSPNQHLNNVASKPLRCNDPKAFIQYSLRTESLRKPAPSPEQTLLTHADEMQETKKAIFKSAVHYNNNSPVEEEDPERERRNSHNELEKYLGGATRDDQRKRYKSSGKLPINSMQNCEEEDSRTEIISYRKEQLQNDCSIVSSRHSIEKQARELSKRSEALSREITQSRLIQHNLKAENKELRAKLVKYEQEIDEQSSQIANLNKRYELRENSSAEEGKQLRSKLTEVQTQLHQLLLEKNQFLNQMEAKEKEAITALKEKEKAMAEDKRKLLIQIELKKQEKDSLLNDHNELQDSLNHSQKMITDLIIEMESKEKQCINLQKSLESLKLEMMEKNSTLQGLETEVVDKGKAVEDLKVQKKIIYEIKHERDQKDVALNQSAATIKELQLSIVQKDEIIRTKANAIEAMAKEIENLKNQLKQEEAVQAELVKRLSEYELELKRSADNSTKISKQIKTVESELKGIKRQASSEATQKNKLVGDYEAFIESLQESNAALTDQKTELEELLANLNRIYKQREDECYDLGQQLIASKEEIANLTNDVDLVREENNYLTKAVQDLTEKEERLMRTEEKLEYNQRLYQELEQKHELQCIELDNQIKGLEERVEERTDAMRNLSDQLRKAEREQLELQDQIETLKIALASRTSELNFLKVENERSRDNTIQFEQRMAMLRRTQESATSTLEELREENEALKRVVLENSEVMATLGKRYDSLHKSTVQSLAQMLDLIRSDRSIINSTLRHEKPQISSLLNDCIRYIATERDSSKASLAKLSKALEEETAANKENMKMIRLKAQIQKELEEEMAVVKAYGESLQAKISELTKDIENHLQTIRQKTEAIADLQADMAALQKAHAAEIAKKEESILKAAKEADRLNHQIELDAQRYAANIEKVKLEMANLEASLQAKIAGLSQTISELTSELKSERESAKLQRLKINELESANSKVNKQKQDVMADLEKRTADLIAARQESDSRSKTLTEKENQIASLQKSIEKLNSEKSNLQSKLQRGEELNKEISIKKAETEATLKERNNEMLVLKLRMDESEDAKSKLVQQKQQLIKSKGTQESLIATLNQTIKTLKDAAIANDDNTKKLVYERDCADKENTKKLNLMANEKALLEKQLTQLKLKTEKKESEFTAKERTLQEELKASRLKVGEHSTTIQELRKEVEAANAKMSTLLKDFNSKTAELQTKQKSLLPSAGKLREVMQAIGELRAIGKEYESSKGKLLRLTSSTRFEGPGYERICEVSRELGVAINKVKIQVLNKLGLAKEVKTALLESLKGLQAVAEKLNAN